MKIDIYRCHQQLRFIYIGVPAGKPLPEPWDGTYFKTIDLQPGQPRIGMIGDADTILANIVAVGWSVM